MIQVLLFAHLREQVGQDELAIPENQMTVAELRTLMVHQYALHIQDVMVAVNEAYAVDTDVIYDGDTVALIPPVSGG
ncbi:molybdopterin converting factor subunit 1 [Sporolactobacillus sp. THM7-7]|nr:molybdopterin converting factor subunit 1 [Sporolactobacillus sp. THM7-7]